MQCNQYFNPRCGGFSANPSHPSGMLCKLAINNQDLASSASEGESPPLSLTTMESLFNLEEVAARRFLSEMK
jgi:hypothetical protein